jgi:methionyl-tRNA formyltransferase
VREGLGLEVAGVLTQGRKEFGGEHDLAALAGMHGIPVFESPEDIPACDIIYSVQYHLILKQRHIDKAREIALNLHMAPLPEYRGCNQFSFAIVDGKKEFGTTIHEMDAGIDHGDILFEKRFAIPEDCWVQELYELTLDASVALFENTLPAIVAGDYTKTPQQALIGARGSSIHYRKDIAALKVIDLNWDADSISRHVRATSMPGFEPPYAFVGEHKVYFSR